jgi:hypothetical protein
LLSNAFIFYSFVTGSAARGRLYFCWTDTGLPQRVTTNTKTRRCVLLATPR